MKLYQVPRYSLVRPITPTTAPPGAREVEQNEVVRFHHIDGMYSYCFDTLGHVVHLPAWQEVEIVDENLSNQ